MSRPPRIPGFAYIGLYRYFLTFRTFHRTKAFSDPDVVERTLAQFRRTATAEAFAILAYCLMPDHVHLLVEGLGDSADLRKFVKLAKQRSGGTYARAARQRLWQEGYYDRVLREHDDIKGVARYILHNPVRAGLVVTPSEYPYLGSDIWSLSEFLEGVA